MSDRVWYLAAAGKTVGPMSVERVNERLATGKVPAKAKAWREGMAEWALVRDIPEFSSDVSGPAAPPDDTPPPIQEEKPALPPPPPAAPAHAAAPAAPAAAPAARNGNGHAPARPRKTDTPPAPRAPSYNMAARLAERRSIFAIFSSPDALPLKFQQPFRIEKKDRWKAFGFAFARSRVLLDALLGFGGGIAVGMIGGVGGLASTAHWTVGLPFALLAMFVGVSVNLVTWAALAYQTRHQILGLQVPSIREALGFVRRHIGAIVVVPFSLTLATLIPIVALVILSLFLKIPYVGPIVTGLIYGVHILLGAMFLFFSIASALSWTFGPVVVAFEETTVRGTIQVLFDFAKRSTLRTLHWLFLPGVAFYGYAVAVVFAAILIVGIPLAINAAIVAPDLLMEGDVSDLGSLPGGLGIGLVPLSLWLGVVGALTVSLLRSAVNAIISILYLAGRRGNDDLITRETWLARRAEGAAANAG